MVTALRLLASSFLLLQMGSSTRAGELYIKADGSKADKDDEYVCHSIVVPFDRVYIKSFIPDLNKAKVHHLLLYSCVNQTIGLIKDCFSPCAIGQSIIYAWANNAPKLDLPKGVSYEVGSQTSRRYIVAQFHYKDHFSDPDYSQITLKYTEEKTENFAGIFLAAPWSFDLQPRNPDIRVVWTCSVQVDQPITAFAARVHGHNHDRANALFYKDGVDGKTTWRTVVERSPQRPQAFYPLDKQVELRNGMELAARCVYNMSDSDHAITPGSARVNEMCNVYIMFYSKVHKVSFGSCGGAMNPNVSAQLPEPNKEELAVDVVSEGHQHHNDKHIEEDVEATPNAHEMSHAHDHEMMHAVSIPTKQEVQESFLSRLLSPINIILIMLVVAVVAFSYSFCRHRLFRGKEPRFARLRTPVGEDDDSLLEAEIKKKEID